MTQTLIDFPFLFLTSFLKPKIPRVLKHPPSTPLTTALQWPSVVNAEVQPMEDGVIDTAVIESWQ